MIGYAADDLRREGIAEEVNAEEIHGHSRRADGRGDRVNDGGIERAGVEEEEELCCKERRYSPTAGAKEEQDAKRQRECDAPEAEQVKGAVVSAEPALGDPAAYSGAEDAVENCAGAGQLAGFCYREADGVVQKFGYPVGDASHGEGEHSKAEGCGEKGWIAKETCEGGAIGCGFDVVLRTADRFAAEETVECRDDEAGDGANEERLSPAPGRSHLSAGHIAKRRANRDRGVEDGKDAIAVPFWVKVGDDGGGEDTERGLADADNGMAYVECPVAVYPCSAEGGEAPQHRACDDERLATVAVAEPAGEWRSQHVDNKHGSGERAHLLARGVEFILNEGEFAGEDVAVDVVEQVEGDQKDQRGESGTDASAGCCGESRQAECPSGSEYCMALWSHRDRPRNMVARVPGRSTFFTAPRTGTGFPDLIEIGVALLTEVPFSRRLSSNRTT
jgi:hypothetical protein